MLAGRVVLDVIGFDAGVPAGDIDALQRDIEQALGDFEGAVPCASEFEIRAQLVFVERVFVGADLFRIVPPVMAFDRKARELFHVGLFFGGAGEPGLQNLGEEVKRGFRRFRHPVLEHGVGMALIAHQLGPPGAQLGNLDGEGAVVELAGVRPQAVAVEQLFAQLAVLGAGHEPFVDGAVEADDPGLVAVRIQRIPEVVRQAAEAGRV